MRKKAAMQVDGRIEIEHRSSARLAAAVLAYQTLVQEETLAESLRSVPSPDGDRVESFEFEGESTTIGIRRRLA
jgi:hypothetical protein